MGKQIATYNNKVKQLVPGYDLKSYSPGTITVTRNSVENEQYASWSLNEDEQGMYIDGYSIGDGKAGYSSNQLVAMVDLYYRYLSPINGENYEGGERPYQLGDDGCIEIDNLSKTIEKGASYEFTLTPKSGFSIVPAGYVEVKDESGWSSIDISWENTEGPVDITIPSDKITGNLRFVLSDCLYKLYILKTVDGHNYGDPEEIGTQNCSDTVNVDSLKPAEDPAGTHFVNITKDGTAISGNQQFCGNTTLNINYAINQYTIDTSGVNSDCVDIVLSPNVQTIEHGESLTITLTPKGGKRNIGAGSITMGNTAVRTWTSERSITETISSVEGDVVVIASCGEDDTYTVTIKWVDGQNTLHTETDIVQSGTSILPEDYVSDWTLPEGYYINSMSPVEGTTILVNSDKTITYDCRLYEYNINFVAGDGITLNHIDSQYVLYGESLTINDVYEINQGYRSATETHTGNAGVSLNNGSVTVTNVKSDVTITISASQVPSYYVSFAFDDSNAGTLDPDRVQVLEGGCAEVGYTLNDYYTIDSITKEGSGDDPTYDPQTNTIKVCNVTGNVNVTIHTNYNPPAETHRVTYTLSGDGIQLYKDGAIVPSQTSSDVVEDGNCSEIGYRLTDGYQFNEATSSVQSIVPTVDTTNKTVEVCPTSDVTITLTASQIQHTITYDIYVDGAKIDTLTQTVAEGETATLQYRKSNTEDYVNPPTVSSNDPNLTVNVVKNTNRGYTITGTPVTQDATISLYLVTKPEYTVTFEVYKDGTLDSSDGWTSNYTEGETFDDETFTYDDSAYEINDVISQELTVDYSYGDSGEIIISNETPITENATIEIRLTSIQQREVNSIEITSSKMDAMGGVVFNGKINYSEGDPDIITDQEKFNLKFEIRDSNDTPYSVDIVDVHDYDFEPGNLSSQTYTRGEKTEIQKTKLNLENAAEDYSDSLTTHSRNEKTINVKIVHKNSGVNKSITIAQRGEKYGYYININSETPSSLLTNNNWLTYGTLVDYGDGYNMYGKENEGLDIYNKDITPYYITGTYIGENPLSHLDNNKTFVTNVIPTDYNKINNSSLGHQEHYHITWYEGSGISVNNSDKGKIFTGDSINITSEFCGGDETPDCDCYEYTTKGTSTLEAIKSTNEGIAQPVLYTYNCSYVKPIHRYGIDSVSYYHLLNNNYRSEIIDTQDNPNPFIDTSGNSIEFSYPVHIYTSEEEDTTSKNTSGLLNINSLGSGWSAYPLNTIRWTKSDSSPYYTLTPNDSYYDTYDYSNNPIYYDYANKIKTGTDSGSDILIFDMYNNPYYIFDENNPRTGETNSNNVIVGEEPTDTSQNKLLGRYIDLYYTLMSPETLIRPIHVNNQTKFAVLTSEHNGTKYGDYSESGNCVELPLDEYVNNSLGRTRYVSEVFYDTTKIKEEPITTADDPELGIDLDKYPYAISGINTDYLHKYVPATEGAPEEYIELNERDSDGALQYKAYNLIADISFKQYYNNAINRATKLNYYAHNPDNAKYVICTDSFDDAYYDYYYGDEISGIEDWKRILAEGIQSIDYNYSDYRWHIVTNSGEYKASDKSTTSLSYYYNLTLTLSPIYTNAHSVEISFNSCENANCGLGRWEILMLDSDDGHAILQRVAQPVSNGVVTLDRNTLGHNVEIHITVGTSEQEYNPNSDCIEYSGDINEYTGGGQINIACKWSTIGIYGGVQTRTIMANIGGTCNKPEHPNTSGTYLTWDLLKQYYRDDVNGCTVFTNKGKHLVPKTAND